MIPNKKNCKKKNYIIKCIPKDEICQWHILKYKWFIMFEYLHVKIFI